MQKEEKSGNEILRVVPVQPVVGSHAGEVEVSITNRTRRAWRDVQLRVREVPDGRPSPSPLFAVIPSESDGAYRIEEVPAGETVRRTFSLRPVHADVGSVTRFEASVEGPAGCEAKHFVVPVEARGEAYAAIGAVEWLRETLHDTYRDLERKGRDVQRSRGLRWPAGAADAADVLLGEKSFRALFEVVEIGARLADRLGRKRDGEG